MTLKRKLLIAFTVILALGLLLPARGVIPVQNATPKDWDKYSYWYYPWGESGVHKGVDVFAKADTPVLASVSGIVLFKGHIKLGGNVIAVLGPKWRLYYYAHLQSANVHALEWVSRGERIGAVGTTGNAAGKPAHLHFSIITIIPNPAEITTETQGWKRMFYVNPARAF
jgi:peptidoglycan LD-endopeptidase LytH